MKKMFIVLSVLLILVTTGCSKDERTNNIVVLFTNDIHGSINENIGLDSVAYYKKQMLKENKYVTMVDCGDVVQGSYLCTFSKGAIGIEAINAVGYDYCVIGNHEFDFGTDRLKELMDMNNAQYLGCNIFYSGSKESILNKVKPYDIKTFGKTKVAFIGVSTPETIIQSTPKYFQEDGEYVYSFSEGENGQKLYDTVQSYVNEVRDKGADYVIVLSHLGINPLDEAYSSESLIKNTTGIDALLDGHSHSVFVLDAQANLEGDYVLTAQTGTNLTNLGKLVIFEDGSMSIENISEIEGKDEEVSKAITDASEEYSYILEDKIGYTDVALSIYDENNIRTVRSKETAIGDLCADAKRIVYGTDIAYINGGGVRDSIEKGDVTYSDIISVHPFGNLNCVVEVTGQEVVDMLEFFTRLTQKDYVDADGNLLCEDGSFACVSGVKFTVDTSIPSSVVMNENDMLIEITGPRRVSDVCVLENGEYVPIDLNKTYTFASIDYVIKNGGCGMELFLKDHNVIVEDNTADYEILAEYIRDYLKGDLSSYSDAEERITIK